MHKRGELLAGTSGWNYYDWKGRFYPADLKAKDYLAHYAKHFLTTEVNYSFYHLPQPTTYSNWASQVPKDFVFAVKASRFITHIRRFREVEEAWQKFLDNAAVLGQQLGPILLQLPPSFRQDTKLLEGFLQDTRMRRGSKDLRLAFEFRHATWFDDPVYEILEQHGAALVIAHSQPYPQAPCLVTAPFVYLRFHGPGRLFASEYSREELEGWAKKIRTWLTRGMAVYAYFNNDYHGYALENAKLLGDLV